MCYEDTMVGCIPFSITLRPYCNATENGSHLADMVALALVLVISAKVCRSLAMTPTTLQLCHPQRGSQSNRLNMWTVYGSGVVEWVSSGL